MASSELGVMEERLLHKLRKTAHTHQLFADGDRVMVCLSGGKDSHTLLHLLNLARRSWKERFSIVAVHLDQQQPGYDGAPLVAYLEQLGVPFEVLREDTYSVVREVVAEGGTPCGKCSRLRRGILYTAAARLGATKIALGHHREDTLETLLMNLIFTGKLQAMPAKYTTDDGRFEVIRPLIEVAESEIATFAEAARFPIIPCTLCGSHPDSKREAVARLLTQLESLNPLVKQSLMGALQNVRPTHLLDVEVAEAWAGRSAEVPAKSAAKERPMRFAALPVVSQLDSLLAPPE